MAKSTLTSSLLDGLKILQEDIRVNDILERLQEDIREKQVVADALEFLPKIDKLETELNSTNKALEREINSNTEYLSKLKLSIKNYELTEKKAKEQEMVGVKQSKGEAQKETKDINDNIMKKRKWKDEKIAEFDDDVKEKESAANRRKRKLSTDISELEDKHTKVKNAYEEIKKLANV
jgi:hypothetical protein